MRLNILLIASFIISVYLLISANTIANLDGPAKLTYKSQFEDSTPINNSSIEFGTAKIFEMRYEYYREEMENFRSIQIGILVIIIAALLVIIFDVKNLTLPLVSIPVPDGIVYWAIFFAGVYLWVNFGLTLNGVIDTRLSLHYLLKDLQLDVSYRHSLEHVLADSSLIDNWCSYYFDIFNIELDANKNYVAFHGVLGFFGLFGIYAYVLGLLISTTMISTLEFIKRKNINPMVSIMMLVFLILMFGSSSILFGWKMPYANYWLMTIWLWALVGLIIWKFAKDKLVKNKTNH